MSLIQRKRRQYTVEGGWGRDPSTFERARDFVADVATSIGRAACSVLVRPQHTEEERREKTRQERTGGNWKYVAPDKVPLVERVRKTRLAALAVAATAAVVLLSTPESNEKPETPAAGTEVIVATPSNESSAEVYQPSFTEEEARDLTAAYEATKQLWAKRGVDPSQSNMVLVSGSGSSYNCPTGNFSSTIQPSDQSAYCRATNTIVLTPYSLQGWTPHMGAVGARFQLASHEYGHYISDLTGTNSEQSPANERSADCYAGATVMALVPTEFAGVRDAILYHAESDMMHGPRRLLADAFAQGGATGGLNGSCQPNNFLAGAVAGS